jgi:hypothetical protein
MAGIISPTEIKPIFTTLIEDRYDELMLIKPTKFLQSFFKKVITKVLYPAIDVRRGTQRVGVDVYMGHQGVRTQLTEATQKTFDLFYFFYFCDITKMQPFYNVFGSGSFSTNELENLVDMVSTAEKANIDLIERAIEVWCAEVMEYGTVTSFRDGTVVNFNRKAGSMVDLGAGNYWNVPGVDPGVSIGAMCDFIVQNGKYTGGVYHMIVGTAAQAALNTNTVVLDRSRAIDTLKLENIIAPEMKLEGQTYIGTIYPVGGYIVHMWMYNQFYEKATAYPETPTSTYVSTPYINPKKVFILPAGVQPGDLIYGACPQLSMTNNTGSLEAGEFHFKEDMNVWEGVYKRGVESRVLPVPVRIDQFGTIQVVA